MSTEVITSDAGILNLLRRHQAMTVAELACATGVTATAVRQRLNRLMGKGFVVRNAAIAGRGRPSHQYSLTDAGRRQTGANFADLAIALWEVLREVEHFEVRRGLLSRIAKQLAMAYTDQIRGRTIDEKMSALVKLFEQRELPFEIDRSKKLPVLTALACPYPELVEQDRSVCAMEKMLFSELLGEGVKLSQCRLDGATCCTFELVSAESAGTPA